MAVQGSCHCGNVRMELPSKPEWVADCNCSLCRRLAWRVAYFPPDQVRISGETEAYVWGDRMIGIHATGTTPESPGSPDRLDAIVRAMTELFAKQRPPPRVRAS